MTTGRVSGGILVVVVGLCLLVWLPKVPDESPSNKSASQNPTETFSTGSKVQSSERAASHKQTDATTATNEHNAQTTEFSSEVHEKRLLQMPQRVQETNYYCVPATVQMLLSSFGFEVEQKELAQKMQTQPATGTEYLDLAKTVNRYLFNKELAAENETGYHVEEINEKNEQELSVVFEQRVKRNIDTGYPTFAAVDLHSLYQDFPKANHMVLVVGYLIEQADGTITAYYLIDPYPSVQDPNFGGLKIVTTEELLTAICQNEEPAYIW